MDKYDVIVIGGGPGGYVAAIRCSQLGLKTALVEKDALGGVCLNWGCIPTKSLLHNAEVISLLKQGKIYGFDFDMDSLKVDYGAAQKRSREVSSKLVKGIEYLMKKNKIDTFFGTARFTDKYRIEIEPEGQVLEGKNIIIAAGSKANLIPGIASENQNMLTARKALELTELPHKVLVVGAGAIGMEFASIWNSYGADVTVIEMMKNILPLEDSEISIEVRKQYEKRGIKILTETRVEKVDSDKDGVKVTCSHLGKVDVVNASKLLISAGVRPCTEGLGLERLGLELVKGYIKVDDSMQTNIPGIYAVGDITGKMPLAHVASAQGVIGAERIAGLETKALEYHNMPRCTYGSPETASVGLTEAQAVEKGYSVKTGKFPFSANGKALGLNETAGMVKVVTDSKYGQILGVHMVGPHVTEMLAGPAGLIALEGTVEELSGLVHPHPTLSEVIMEAAHNVNGSAIHI